MTTPDRVALGAMAGTAEVPSNGVGRGEAAAAARAAAIAEMPDFPEETAEAGPEPTAPEATPEPKVEPKADDSSLVARKKQEARQRDDHAQREAKLSEREKSIADQVKELEKLKAWKERAALEPDAVLEELLGGLDDEKALHAARRLYARTELAKKDPRHKATAEQSTKELAVKSELAKIREEADKRIASLEAKIEAKDKAEAAAKFQADFRGTVEKAVTDATPLVKARLTKNPGRALEGLAQAAVTLMQRDETDEMPDAEDIVAQYQTMLSEELAELGIEPAKPVPGKTVPKPAPIAKSLTGDLSAGTKAIDPKKETKEERRERILREMPDIDD